MKTKSRKALIFKFPGNDVLISKNLLP